MEPIATLEYPVVFARAALYPNAALSFAVVAFSKDWTPKHALSAPVVLLRKALDPATVLAAPEVVAIEALKPIIEFKKPLSFGKIEHSKHFLTNLCEDIEKHEDIREKNRLLKKWE